MTLSKKSHETLFSILLFALIVSNSLLGNDFLLIKVFFLGLMCLYSLLVIITRKRFLVQQSYFLLVFFVFIAFSICIGVSNGFAWDDTCSRLLRYYLFFPIVFILIGSLFTARKHLKKSFFRVLDAATFTILVFCIMEQLYLLDFLPWWPFDNIMSVEGMIVDDNQTIIQLSCETIFSFLLPFYTLRLFDKKKRSLVSFLIIAMFIVYVFISERKILVLIFVVSFLIGFLFFIFSKIIKIGYLNNFKITGKKVFIFSLVVVGVIVAFVYLNNLLSFSDLFDQLSNHLEKGLMASDSGIVKRTRQTSALLSGWTSDIFTLFIGNGIQSYVKNDIANSTYKWNYEVFYPAWIYQTGLIGTLLLLIIFGFFAFGLYKAYKVSKDRVYLYLLASFVFAIISSGTNPCINEYWFFLLPSAFLFENKMVRYKSSIIKEAYL